MIHAIDAGSIPCIDIDPYDPDVLRDPYGMQERIREAGRVVWIALHSSYGVARHEDVTSILRNWKEFTSAAGAGLSDIRKPGAWRIPGPIVEVDPPRHTQVRTTMNRIISPQVVRGWRELFMREAEMLCDRVLEAREFDAVPTLVEAYVLKVFPGALGIEVNQENLITIGNHNFNSIGPKNDLFLKSQAKMDAIARWFEQNQRSDSMIPGGFGETIFQAEAAGELPEGVASPMLRTLLRGGMDTTIAGIGSALWLLATHQDQWALVREKPSLVGAAFEEAIRLETPIQTFYRTTAGTAVEFAGERLMPETKVQLFIGAANRDPRKWDQPASFDITRNLARHVAFGAGIHLCIGQTIARLEAECLLGAFLKRVSTIELNGTATHRLLNSLRTLDTLPLRVTLS